MAGAFTTDGTPPTLPDNGLNIQEIPITLWIMVIWSQAGII